MEKVVIDVREQLYIVMKQNHGECGDYTKVIDAIVARFDLTPKPAVSYRALGEMVAEAHDAGRLCFDEQGKSLIQQLENDGLKIVRADK
jgi:hypothetical protein